MKAPLVFTSASLGVNIQKLFKVYFIPRHDQPHALSLVFSPRLLSGCSQQNFRPQMRRAANSKRGRTAARVLAHLTACSAVLLFLPSSDVTTPRNLAPVIAVYFCQRLTQCPRCPRQSGLSFIVVASSEMQVSFYSHLAPLFCCVPADYHHIARRRMVHCGSATNHS